MSSVLFLTEGRHVPSTRYRVKPLIPYLEEMGYRCTVRHCWPNKYFVSRKRSIWPIYDALTSLTRLLQIMDAGKFDIIFLQRDLARWSHPFLEKLLFKINANVVFDLDDAQWLFSSKHKIRYIAQRSRVCTVGNGNLQNFFQPTPTKLLPTIVDVQCYPVKQHMASEPVIIGWTGTSFNYPFFDGYRELFRSLLEPGKVELNIISNGGIIQELEGLPVNYIKWHPEIELKELNCFDIGVMPLPDNELTRNKCGLKLVQYQALGIPSVASAIGANLDIIQHGKTGYLCKSLTEWHGSLSRLINTLSLRREMGAEARANAESSFNAPTVARQLATIFEQLNSHG